MQTDTKKKVQINYKRLTVILTVYLTMFFFGYGQGSDFVARPMIHEAYQSDAYEYVDYLYPVSLAIGALLYYYTSTKVSLITASIIFCLGSLLFALAENIGMVMGATVASSIAYGCFEIALNAFAFILFRGNTEARLICWLYFFFAFGEVISTSNAPQIAHIFEMGYGSIYAFLIAFAFLITILFITIDFSSSESIEIKKPNYSLRDAFSDSRVWFFIALFTLIEYIESFILNDVLTYIATAFQDPSEPLDLLAFTEWILYFYAGSRLFLGYFVDKIGHFRSIMICIGATVILLLITAFCGLYGVFVVIFSGIFIGLLYPTIFTIAMDYFGDSSILSILVVLVISNIGSFIGKGLTFILMYIGGFFTGITLSILFGLLSIVLIYWYSTEVYVQPARLQTTAYKSGSTTPQSSYIQNPQSDNGTLKTSLLVTSIDQQFNSI